MSELVIRLATRADIEALVEMRRAFTFEDPETSEAMGRSEFEAECSGFLAEAISSGRWQIWVAELGAQIVAHVYVALIDKVPRPVGESAKIAYLTSTHGQSSGAAALEPNSFGGPRWPHARLVLSS